MGELLDPNENRSKLSDAAVAGSDNGVSGSTAAAAAAVSGGDAGKDVGGDEESESCWRGRSTGG